MNLSELEVKVDAELRRVEDSMVDSNCYSGKLSTTRVLTLNLLAKPHNAD